MTGANEVPEPVALRGLHRLDDDVVVPSVGTDLVDAVDVRILHGTIEPHVEEQGAVARPLIGPDPQELPVDGEAHLGRQVLRDGTEREGVGLDCRIHGGRCRLAAEVADHLVRGGGHAVLFVSRRIGCCYKCVSAALCVTFQARLAPSRAAGRAASRRSTSSGLVSRPREQRSVERAGPSSKPIARST